MVMVFHVERYSILTDRVVRSQCKMTEARATTNGGAIIEDTGEDVPESALDSEGRYYPEA
jgi:hypothetical protein